MMENSLGAPAVPLPEPNTLRAPDSKLYGHPNHFMGGETQYARMCGLLVPPLEAAGLDPLTKSATFGSKPINAAVQGLYGDTAVAVVSEKGVWISHLGNIPSFRTEEDMIRDVITQIRDGDKTDQKIQDLVASYGLADVGDMFDEQYKPKIIVLTPRAIGYAAEIHVRYALLINLLLIDLNAIIPKAEFIVTCYNPHLCEANYLFSTKGKLLVQYTASQEIVPGRRPLAMVRVYADVDRKPVYEHSWDAYPSQDCTCPSTSN